MYPDVWDDDETPYTWTIHVNQPWWRTTGVYIVLLLLLFILLGVNFWLYSRNTKLRLRRSEAEGDVVRKVRSFIERFNLLSVEPLSPLEDELFGEKENERKQLSPEFTELMLKLIPYLHSHRQAELTMNLIVKVAGMEIMKLYDMLTQNLYKNPRELVRVYRLRQAEDMLLHSDKSIGQIAADCGFYTPNYFIGNFFHHYKQTPLEYRRTQANG
jgi:AraC-like DNA-binding protein